MRRLPRTSRPRQFARVAACVLVAPLAGACTDAAPTAPAASTSAAPSRSEGRGVFHRYVAIGTSVSMGWHSDGVLAASQRTSWPAQLAGMAGRVLSQPYIAGTGCRSPLVAPLALGVRLSGEAVTVPTPQLGCSPLQAGISLPTQNVAVNAARTRDALRTTPQTVTDASNAALYTRVLPPGASQVTAMMAQNPKLVSVELGGNEVLDARFGIAVTGVTLTPFDAWSADYAAVLDSVERVTRMAVVVGLARDVRTIPAFRHGRELWADRAAFLAGFHVEVATDCAASENLLFVPIRVPTAVSVGAARRQAGLPPAVLSCAPGGPLEADHLLTPDERAIVDALLARMNDRIRAEAAARGFAHFELAVLYERAELRRPFSVVELMTSATPYGALIGLDGVHPSAAGSAVLAAAAAHALDARYRLGLTQPALALRPAPR